MFSPLGFRAPPKPGSAVAIPVTSMVPAVRAICAAVRPTMMYSEFGDGSAASPIGPASRPW